MNFIFTAVPCTANYPILDIYYKEVFSIIQHNEPGWEEKVPPGVARLTKEKRLFQITT
ncbi:MAG: hypothetical protein ACKVT2_03020 [Saprospiraceae bacterium]